MKELEKLKREMENEFYYARKMGALGDYGSIEADEAATEAVSIILDYLEPIIYKKLEEAYNLGKKKLIKKKTKIAN